MVQDLATQWIQNCPCTAQRIETTGSAVRTVQRVKEGTPSASVESGLQQSWWAEAVECCCHLRQVQDLLADGQTLHEQRFNSPFDGPIIPCGAEVKFYPTTSKDQGRVHQFGTQDLPGFFIGWALNAGEKLDWRFFDSGYRASANNATI